MDHWDFTSAFMDMDLVQLFLRGGCVETTDQCNLCQSPVPLATSPPDFNFLPPFDTTSNSNKNNLLTFQSNPKSRGDQEKADPFLFSQGNNKLNKAWWMPSIPTVDATTPMSVKMRLMQAIHKLRDETTDRNVLIQIWVPIRVQGKNVLTTTGQPFTVDPECKSLEYYRSVSEKYYFPAEEDSKESAGLIGRVYLNKMPEWTPDVKLFKSTEYPRIVYAQKFNVQGSIALPVFEGGSGNCLGVVEIVTTTQKINYRSDLEQVCKALETFDLKSTETCSASSIKACNELCQPSLPEIVEVLTSICRTHRLPLAQTWAQCVQRDKGETLRSYTDHAHCAYILDSAFYAADPQILEFHKACSDHNLYKGQGVVGRAFTTDKPCFEPDVTTYTKTEYPLSHHAKRFGLRAAVAVRLRSVHTGSTEFVLEFFLPTDCQSNEAQRKMLAALSYSLKQAGQNLRSLTGLELKEDVLLPLKEAMPVSKVRPRREGGALQTKSSPPKESYQGDSSWTAGMMGSKEKGKGVSVSLEYKKEPQEEFNWTTHWDNFEKEALNPQLLHDLGTRLRDSARRGVIENNGGEYSSLSAQRLSGSRRTGEKRTKTEKTISLQVLRQHFAGSLKDAAKNIGVCPTTLKRICRQHGITRWPSRKIKKVNHSLRKIQRVIDSIQGAEEALQIGNFYSSYRELGSLNESGSATPPFSSLKTPLADQLKQLPQPNLQRQDSVALFSHGGTSSKSPSSWCSQSSCLSLCCSSGTHPPPLMSAHDLLGEEDGLLVGGGLERACSETEFHVVPKQEESIVLARAQSHKALGQPYPISSYRVKATYGDEKFRFRLQETWVFRDVQEEIRKKFHIEDIRSMDIKYLDDASEWVLLTCDADLEECIDICRSCQLHTLKMCVHVKCPSNIGS